MSVSGNPVTMYSPPTSQQHIFYLGAGNSAQGFFIEHTYRNPSGVIVTEPWVGPKAHYIQASRTPPLAAYDPATMFTDDTGQQHIFYVGIDSGLHHVFYDPNRKGLIYEQWASGAVGIPATMYAPGQYNEQHVFYRGTDGGFHQVFYDPNGGGSLTPEQWVTPQQEAYGNPATLYYPPTNQQHLFYLLLGGGLGHTFWGPNTGRHTETWLNGFDRALTASGDHPATMYSYQGPQIVYPQQHVFCLAASPDNTWGGEQFILHAYYDVRNTTNPTLEPWGSVDELGSGHGAVGNPATMYYPPTSQQHIFYRAEAYQQGFVIWHIFWDPTRGLVPEQWVGPKSIMKVGINSPPPAAGDPATMFSSDYNQQHIFYRAVDGGIWEVLFDPSTGPNFEQWV
jgi:hypothetical protein